MSIAKFSIIEVSDLQVVIDDDQAPGHPTVTNSAAKVVAALHDELGGLGRRRVFYRDTSGRYDELRHENGVFTGFAPGTPSQQAFFKTL